MNHQRRIVSDAAAVSAANGIAAGTQLLETILLARLLLPQDIGRIAIIAVILGFVRSFADLGLGNALIHFQDTSRRAFSTLYWLLLAWGVAIFFAFLCCRPLVSLALPGSQLAPLFGWIGLNFLLHPVGILYQYTLQRDMLFRRIAYAEGAARCAGTLTVAVLVFGGAGIVSYVAGQLAYSAVKSLLLLYAGFRRQPPAIALDFRVIRAYFRFGLYQMGERCVTFFASNIDYIIIGKLCGVRELGFYKIAFELATVPLRLVNPVFSTVALPRFAKNQHDDGVLREGVLSMLRLLTLITFPLLFGLAASANVFIPVVYGEGWDRAVPLLWLLVPMGLLKTLGNIGGSIIIAKGRVKTGFFWNCVGAAGNCGIFLIVAGFGTGAVAAAYSIVSLFYFWLSFRSYYTATIGLTPIEYLSSFSLPAVMSAVMAAAVYSVHCALRWTTIPTSVELIVLVAFGAGVYVLLNIALMRKKLAELLRGLRSS